MNERAPLFDLGITKADVRRFWDAQPYKLGLDERNGNCINCFLKDERDLATNLLEDEEHAARWVGYERDYGPMRRGGRPSYAQVLAEAPARMEIRAAMAEGRAFTVDISPRRVKLIVNQELAARSSFSCECDAAKADDFDDGLNHA